MTFLYKDEAIKFIGVHLKVIIYHKNDHFILKMIIYINVKQKKAGDGHRTFGKHTIK